MLDRLRSQVVSGPGLPDLAYDGLITFPDLVSQFCQAVEGVGGACTRVSDLSEVSEKLHALDSFINARRVASLVPECVRGNTDMRMYEDPHYLKGLDWLIGRGHFGVAENGAIWVDFNQVPHRVCFFITQYLALVVDASSIVPHMHAAYDRVGEDITASFGLFLSGPSKTADIEQSLVLGAHGARTLNVFVIG